MSLGEKRDTDAAPGRRAPRRPPRAYLAREVAAWSAANRCYSCHNNGDATRALYAAGRLGLVVPDESLADTTRWLADPASWDHNGAADEGSPG